MYHLKFLLFFVDSANINKVTNSSKNKFFFWHADCEKPLKIEMIKFHLYLKTGNIRSLFVLFKAILIDFKLFEPIVKLHATECPFNIKYSISATNASSMAQYLCWNVLTNLIDSNSNMF